MNRTGKISNWIARQIVREITANGWAPGVSLLPEAAMVDLYSVSRGSLREALRLLEAQGLIHIRRGPGGGPVTGSLSSAEFARTASLFFHVYGSTLGEILEVRLLLEPVMARLAVGRCDSGLLSQLRMNGELEAQERHGQQSHHVELSGNFHKIISEASGNVVFELFVQSLNDVYNTMVEKIDPPESVNRMSIEDHSLISRAIYKRDEDGAEALMRKHIQNLITYLSDMNGPLDKVVDWIEIKEDGGSPLRTLGPQGTGER